MKCQNLEGHSRFVLLAIFFFVTSITVFPNDTSQKPRPAGTAVFPIEASTLWRQVQDDSAVSDLDKAIDTINRFFRLNLQSLMDDKLYDFGFLFDKSDKASLEDYLYERGFQYISLAGHQAWGVHYLSYEYKPKILNSEYTPGGIEIHIDPLGEVIISDTPSHIDPAPFTDFYFEMVKSNGRWLISRVKSKDVLHNRYPRGMDFNAEAKRLKKEIEGYRNEEYAHRIIKSKRASMGQAALAQQGQYRTFRKYECQWYALQYSSNDAGTDSYNLLLISFPNSDC